MAENRLTSGEAEQLLPLEILSRLKHLEGRCEELAATVTSVAAVQPSQVMKRTRPTHCDTAATTTTDLSCVSTASVSLHDGGGGGGSGVGDGRLPSDNVEQLTAVVVHAVATSIASIVAGVDDQYLQDLAKFLSCKLQAALDTSLARCTSNMDANLRAEIGIVADELRTVAQTCAAGTEARLCKVEEALLGLNETQFGAEFRQLAEGITARLARLEAARISTEDRSSTVARAGVEVPGGGIGESNTAKEELCPVLSATLSSREKEPGELSTQIAAASSSTDTLQEFCAGISMAGQLAPDIGQMSEQSSQAAAMALDAKEKTMQCRSWEDESTHVVATRQRSSPDLMSPDLKASLVGLVSAVHQTFSNAGDTETVLNLTDPQRSGTQPRPNQRQDQKLQQQHHEPRGQSAEATPWCQSGGPSSPSASSRSPVPSSLSQSTSRVTHGVQSTKHVAPASINGATAARFTKSVDALGSPPGARRTTLGASTHASAVVVRADLQGPKPGSSAQPQSVGSRIRTVERKSPLVQGRSRW